MKKEKTIGFMILFAVFILLLLVKLLSLLMIISGTIEYILRTTESSSIQSQTIIMLMLDFVAVLLLLLINKKMRYFRKATSIVLLCSPILLLTVMALSVVAVAYVNTPQALGIDIASWIIMYGYLLVNDTMITLDMINLWKNHEDKSRHEPTLSERIRKAKK